MAKKTIENKVVLSAELIRKSDTLSGADMDMIYEGPHGKYIVRISGGKKNCKKHQKIKSALEGNYENLLFLAFSSTEAYLPLDPKKIELTF